MSTCLVMVDCNHAIHPAYQEECQAHKQNTSDRSTIGDRDEPEPFASKEIAPGLVWFWVEAGILFCVAAKRKE